MGSKVSELLYDGKRCILKNLHLAPLQLYCAELVFPLMESTTCIRKALERQRCSKIYILPQEEKSWSTELQTLDGHSDRVQAVAFTPGKLNLRVFLVHVLATTGHSSWGL